MREVLNELLVDYMTQELRRDKGLGGEFLAYAALEALSAPRRALWGLYVPCAKGSTQLDLVLVHATGLYVVESKNWNGVVRGDETAELCRVEYKSGRTHTPCNPLKQNETHVKALQDFLAGTVAGDGEAPVHSIVAYGDGCSFEGMRRSAGSQVVQCCYAQLGAELLQLAAQSAAHLAADEVDALYLRLQPLTNPSDKVQREHLDYVRAVQGRQRN